MVKSEHFLTMSCHVTYTTWSNLTYIEKCTFLFNRIEIYYKVFWVTHEHKLNLQLLIGYYEFYTQGEQSFSVINENLLWYTSFRRI
jgi:hypothetical protein